MKYIKHKDFQATNGASHSIYIIREDGKSMARVYFFYDDPDNGYLDNLSVNESARKQGEGTRLQKMREGILKRKGYKTARLWVKKDSWMYVWYQRRGYKSFKDHDKEVGCVWMEKIL
jgi:GNAT superfamily N-acetyltransferase